MLCSPLGLWPAIFHAELRKLESIGAQSGSLWAIFKLQHIAAEGSLHHRLAGKVVETSVI